MTERGRVIRMKLITREHVRTHPNTIFVFGDNMQHRGFGGQAKAMRGEPNSIGVPTKWTPRRDPGAYFNDEDWDGGKAKGGIAHAFDRIEAALAAGRDVVIPIDGLGTGLAELLRYAPRIARYIDARIANLVNGGSDD